MMNGNAFLFDDKKVNAEIWSRFNKGKLEDRKKIGKVIVLVIVAMMTFLIWFAYNLGSGNMRMSDFIPVSGSHADLLVEDASSQYSDRYTVKTDSDGRYWTAMSASDIDDVRFCGSAFRFMIQYTYRLNDCSSVREYLKSNAIDVRDGSSANFETLQTGRYGKINSVLVLSYLDDEEAYGIKIWNSEE